MFIVHQACEVDEMDALGLSIKAGRFFFQMLLAVSKEEIYSPEKLCLFLSPNICDCVQKK